MSFSASTPAQPPGPAGAAPAPAGARRTRSLVLGALALLGILVAGGIAWWAVLGSSPEPGADDQQLDGFVPEVVPDAPDPAPEADAADPAPEAVAADPAPEADAAEPEDDASAQVEDTNEPDEAGEPTTDPGADPDEQVDPPSQDPGTAGAREQPVPWLSLEPPAGSGWRFTVFAETGLPAFEGTQSPEGYLEVFVDDGYASLGEAVREVELDAAAFGATEIGRDQLAVPGAERAVALLHSVPDESDPFDQGILLLEVADDARPLVVLMVMLSEGAGPTLFEIEETFASVVVDPDALRAATAG